MKPWRIKTCLVSNKILDTFTILPHTYCTHIITVEYTIVVDIIKIICTLKITVDNYNYNKLM